MRRLNPLGSLFGFILTIILLLALSISLWINRGLAFSPGKVTSINKEGTFIQGFKSHAEFEKRCVLCHAPLETDLATKCMDCHTEVKQEIQNNIAVHSRIVDVNECAVCHPEHQGRDFNPTFAAFKIFDHSQTSFSLNWHQENYDASPMRCDECHLSNTFKQLDIQICINCHNSNDQNFANIHPRDFGYNCLDCHDGVDRMQGFDHNQTGFPLEAKHTQIQCTQCHTTNNISDAPKECVGCHAEPSTHQGVFNQSCSACHTSESWSPANLDNQRFSHVENTGFSLALHQVDYSEQIITCVTCHTINLQSIDIQTCINCHDAHDHLFMNDHIQQFGGECMVCHDGVDRLHNFDHANFFPIDGKHADIQCSDCHKDKVFRGTPVNCWECHQEPNIHAGVFGLRCSYCHDTSAWSPANLKEHNFPLNHGLGDASSQSTCDVCHNSNYIEYTCYTCHDHNKDEITQTHLEKGILEQELPDCTKCHPDGTVVKGIHNRGELNTGMQ